ncbi:hypothetical protein C8T65DRAFT_742694 [Cerioporus squamosus]|nr:hypothetical protein C8T65DRAFT_742694 [Cerioporus squamosus]
MFLDADHGRIPYLRDFSYSCEGSLSSGHFFDSYPGDAEAGKLAMSILQEAPNIASLHLLRVYPQMFPPQELRAALACMRQLERLSLKSVSPAYEDSLLDIPASLQAVRLNFHSNHPEPICYNSMPFLRNHRATIRELSLHTVYFFPDLDPMPEVRVLSLHTVYVQGGVATLMRVFPNVEDVTIVGVQPDRSPRRSFEECSELQPEQLEGLNNIHNTHGSSARQLQQPTWEQLRRVSARYALGLYWLGLCARVPHLDLFLLHLFPEVIAPVLRHTRPRCLTLHMEYWFPLRLEVELGGLAGALSVARDLTHLVVRVPWGLLGAYGYSGFMAKLGSGLEKSSISHLLLQLYCERPGIQDQKLVPWGKAVYEDNGLDSDVRLLAQSVPSLRVFFLDVETCGLRTWERELLDVDRCRWREISKDDGRALLAEEDMHSGPRTTSANSDF